jgi:hypothetical protein
LSGPALREILAAVLERGSALRFAARGFSMHPDIRDGDLLTLGPTPPGRVAVGSVVAVVGRGDRLVVHRVIARRGDSYRVQGDTAWQDDGWFRREELVAALFSVERDGKVVDLGGSYHRAVKAFLSRRPVVRRLLWRLS